jgi:hypothetical protein
MFRCQKRRRRLPLLALVALLAAPHAGAAEDSAQRPKLPPDLQPVADLAMSAPPEFAADALLRIAASGRVSDRDARRNLIETAFHIAARAQHPVKLVAAPGTAADTRSGYLAGALRLNLDALSLQSRAVEAMLNIDKRDARELLSQLERPALPALKCEDPLIPDVSAFYAALVRVAGEAFTATAAGKAEQVSFALAEISRVSNNAELPGAARVLNSIAWDSSQFEILLGAFASRLDAMPPDNRTFSYYAQSIEQEVRQVAQRSRGLGVASQGLAQSYRKYLVRQLTAPRCESTTAGRVAGGSGADNLSLFDDIIRGELAPLSPDEMRPDGSGGAAKIDRYWQSAEAKQIFQGCLRLRVAPNGSFYSEEARNTTEWRQQLMDFLNTLASWSPIAEDSEADYYHQKAIVYEALLELTPAGALRDRVLANYIDFLRGSNLQQENPVEWFWHARSTLDRLVTQTAEAKRLRAAFRGSGNTILALEAVLDELAPASPFGPR